MFSDNWLTAVTNFGEPKASMATFSVSSLRLRGPIGSDPFPPARITAHLLDARLHRLIDDCIQVQLHPFAINDLGYLQVDLLRFKDSLGNGVQLIPQASLFDLFTFLKGVNGRSILPESGARRRNRRDKEGDEKCVGKASRLAGATLEA